jgi:DNA-binding XRE family transcriptional regulator
VDKFRVIAKIGTIEAKFGTFGAAMALANFTQADSTEETLKKIGDYVRSSRRSQGKTQTEFAEMCKVSLRTFKRFEAGKSDSLTLLVKIAGALERISALSLLFPDPAPKVAKSRDAVTAFAEVRAKIGK